MNSSPKAISSVSEFELPFLSLETGDEAITCTGLAYDEESNTWWVGSYGRTNEGDPYGHSRIVEVDDSFQKIIGIIDVTEMIDGLNQDMQGVALDESDGTIWFADNKMVYNITKQGELKKIVEFGDKYKKPNGIAYDKTNDSLWVLFFTKYLVNIDKAGTILGEYSCDVEAQDHVYCSDDGAVYFTAGADYSGNRNYVYQYDFDNQTAVPIYQLMDSYAVEGIVLKDGDLYIANDGLYHQAYEPVNVVKRYETGE